MLKSSAQDSQLQSMRMFDNMSAASFFAEGRLMNDTALKVGTLYISREVLQHDRWIVDQAITSAMAQLNKYMGLDGYLKSSPVRRGDFSLTIADHRVSPVVVTFIGIPGKSRAPIIQELFVAL